MNIEDIAALVERVQAACSGPSPTTRLVAVLTEAIDDAECQARRQHAEENGRVLVRQARRSVQDGVATWAIPHAADCAKATAA